MPRYWYSDAVMDEHKHTKKCWRAVKSCPKYEHTHNPSRPGSCYQSDGTLKCKLYQHKHNPSECWSTELYCPWS